MERVKFTQDDGFKAAVVQLREPSPGFSPSFPLSNPAESLPETSYKQRIQWLVERIESGSRVLDLGCSGGDMLYHLKLKRNAQVLGLERIADSVAKCLKIGVPALQVDLNNLEDPALHFACAQKWDFVLIIDTIYYWKNPAVILAALADRCKRIYITVGNPYHIKLRWQFLCGNQLFYPNTRPGPDGQILTTSSFYHLWTIEGFCTWAENLGYHCKPVARRSVRAAYLPLGVWPGLFQRQVLYELTPR